MRFGMISWRRIDRVGMPIVRDASMYDSSRTLSTSDRSARARPAHRGRVMTIPTTKGFFGSKRTAMTITSGRPGTAMIASQIIIRISSTRPPLYPANVPTNVAIAMLYSAPPAIIISMNGVAWMSPRIRSLPYRPVPSGNSRLWNGGRSTGPEPSGGLVSHTPTVPTRTKKTIVVIPNSPRLSFRRMRSGATTFLSRTSW
jgi:hypothetical protein